MTLKQLNHPENEIKWFEDHQDLTKMPAILGLDFMDHTGIERPGGSFNNPELVENASQWWNTRNGIVTICWHWRDPSKCTESFYSSAVNFDLTKIFDESSDEYLAILRDLEIVAHELLALQEKGVAVLWRPLHEAAGGWFWWGEHGALTYRYLWETMYDYFNLMGVHNLIWVYTAEFTNNLQDAKTWYPGDQYVDIVSMDIYTDLLKWSEEEQHGSLRKYFYFAHQLTEGNKMIALSECGPIPDMRYIDNDLWSYIMPWYGKYTKEDQFNSVADWKENFMDDERVLNLSHMPKWPDCQPSFSVTPVACYLFNGNTNDESENSYNFINHGATLAPDQFGQENSAYYFDGVNDYMQAQTKLPISGFPFSISLWTKLEGYGPGERAVFYSSDYYDRWWGRYYGFCVYAGHGGRLLAAYANGMNYTNNTYATDENVITLNTWHHISAVFKDSESVDLYIDGVKQEVTQSRDEANIVSTTSRLDRFGNDYDAKSRHKLKGYLDDIWIFDLPLDSEDIESLMHLKK